MSKPFLRKRDLTELQNTADPNPSNPNILTINYKNGDKYSGNLHKGKRAGSGKYFIKTNSCIYEGNFLDGNRHGFGIFYDKNFIKRYEGFWENNVGQGYGKMFSIDGELIYEGNFKNGKKDGFGKCYEIIPKLVNKKNIIGKISGVRNDDFCLISYAGDFKGN